MDVKMDMKQIILNQMILIINKILIYHKLYVINVKIKQKVILLIMSFLFALNAK